MLCDGDHSLDRCQKVTETVLAAVYKVIADVSVDTDRQYVIYLVFAIYVFLRHVIFFNVE